MRLRERIWPGLRTRGIVLEVAIAVFSTVAISAGAATGDRGPVSVGVFSVLTALTFVLLLTLRRRAPFWPFLLSALLSVLSPAINGALTPLAYSVGRYDGRWATRITATLAGVLVVARPWDGGPAGDQVSRWLGGAVLVLLPGAVGIYVRTRAQLLAALRERAERAEAEQELLARDAVLTERTRIAREMHDAVGHRVSLMVLQAGAIEMAAADPQRVEQLAGQVQTAGRQALDELRQMVGVLRAGEAEDAPLAPQPGLDALPRLVEESRQAGMAVDLDAGCRRRRRRPGGEPRRVPDRAGGADQRRQARTRGQGEVAVRASGGRAGRPVVNGPGHATDRPPAAVTAWWGWLSGCARSAAG